jgi:phosphoesterase RecJ-like protein
LIKKWIHNLNDYLNKYEKFVVSTHESPDGDGLGAEIAFKEFLINIGKKCIIINSDPIPKIFEFIDIDHDINVFSNELKLPEDINDFAQFVLDTNSFDNIGASAYNLLKDKVKDCFIIDHHEGQDERVEKNLIKAEMSSASEIIYKIIEEYKTSLTFKTAQALYTGIVFDTGSFRYPKTSPETFKVASHLVGIGVNPFKVYEQIWEQNSLSGFNLRAKILSSMQSFHDGKLIALKLTREMLKETGGLYSEGETSINLPLTVQGVIISLLVKQDVEGPVKVSMRSKGDYNVAEIALEKGGGGHKNAAGFKSKLNFEETYSSILKILGKFFQ